jgi:hypothetical protein
VDAPKPPGKGESTLAERPLQEAAAKTGVTARFPFLLVQWKTSKADQHWLSYVELNIKNLMCSKY